MEDLSGEVFGVYRVVEPAEKSFEGVPQMGWLCICVCGTPTWKTTNGLKNRVNRTCLHSKDVGMFYNQYVQNAKRRGVVFELERYEFFKIVLRDCYYCGVPPQSRRFFTERKYSLISMKDSAKGYVAGNVVPVCNECNNSRVMWEQEELFIDWARRVHTNHDNQ